MSGRAQEAQLRLFPAERPELPEGFSYFPDFLTRPEETSLLERLENLQWKEVRMHGVEARRKVVHFGLDYAYESRKVRPTEPAPEFLKPLIRRAAALMKAKPTAIEEILLTRYPAGAGIGWHRDAPAFGDTVFGVSLGFPCTMKFRREAEGRLVTLNQELEPRSAYIIAGPARRVWRHGIPPVKGLRYSITLRTLRSGTCKS